MARGMIECVAGSGMQGQRSNLQPRKAYPSLVGGGDRAWPITRENSHKDRIDLAKERRPFRDKDDLVAYGLLTLVVDSEPPAPFETGQNNERAGFPSKARANKSKKHTSSIPYL